MPDVLGQIACHMPNCALMRASMSSGFALMRDKPSASNPSPLSDNDSVAPNGWKPIVARIPGATGEPHVILEAGGHFLQEDVPEGYTRALLGWLGAAGG